MLLKIEMLEEWLEALTIDFEGLSSIRIFNLHGSVWINYLNDEWASPRERSFPGNKCNRELYNSTFWFGSNVFRAIVLSWNNLSRSL